MRKRQKFALIVSFYTADPFWNLPASHGVNAEVDLRTPSKLDMNTSFSRRLPVA